MSYKNGTYKNGIFRPYIHPKLRKFFDKNDEVISVMFSVLKEIKPNIVDAYSYSTKNKPPHIKYKYTDKLYLGCILFIIKYNIGWESFLGPIPGKYLLAVPTNI